MQSEGRASHGSGGNRNPAAATPPRVGPEHGTLPVQPGKTPASFTRGSSEATSEASATDQHGIRPGT